MDDAEQADELDRVSEELKATRYRFPQPEYTFGTPVAATTFIPFGEPRPEPEFGFWTTRMMEDGQPSIVHASIPLHAVLPWAGSLTVDQRHEMLEEAADAENPAAAIRKWQKRASMRAPIQINVQPAPEPAPGYGLGHLHDAYERGRRQGRYEAGG